MVTFGRQRLACTNHSGGGGMGRNDAAHRPLVLCWFDLLLHFDANLFWEHLTRLLPAEPSGTRSGLAVCCLSSFAWHSQRWSSAILVLALLLRSGDRRNLRKPLFHLLIFVQPARIQTRSIRCRIPVRRLYVDDC